MLVVLKCARQNLGKTCHSSTSTISSGSSRSSSSSSSSSSSADNALDDLNTTVESVDSNDLDLDDCHCGSDDGGDGSAASTFTYAAVCANAGE